MYTYMYIYPYIYIYINIYTNICVFTYTYTPTYSYIDIPTLTYTKLDPNGPFLPNPLFSSRQKSVYILGDNGEE